MPENGSIPPPPPIAPPLPAASFADMPALLDVALRHVTSDTGAVADAAQRIAREWAETMQVVRTCLYAVTSIVIAAVIVVVVLAG